MNKTILLASMKVYEDSIETLADELGISTAELEAKMDESNGLQFTKEEIVIIRERYALTDTQVLRVFFPELCEEQKPSLITRRAKVFARIAKAFGDDPKDAAEALGISLALFYNKLNGRSGYSFQRPEIEYLASRYHLTNEGARWLLLGEDNEPAGIPFNLGALKASKQQIRQQTKSMMESIPSEEELADKLEGASLEEMIENLDELTDEELEI